MSERSLSCNVRRLTTDSACSTDNFWFDSNTQLRKLCRKNVLYTTNSDCVDNLASLFNMSIFNSGLTRELSDDSDKDFLLCATFLSRYLRRTSSVSASADEKLSRKPRLTVESRYSTSTENLGLTERMASDYNFFASSCAARMLTFFCYWSQIVSKVRTDFASVLFRRLWSTDIDTKNVPCVEAESVCSLSLMLKIDQVFDRLGRIGHVGN